MGSFQTPYGQEEFVRDVGDRLRRVEANAVKPPPQTLAVELANQFDVITSSTFVPTCHANIPRIVWPVLCVWVVVATDPATTAEVRLGEYYGMTATDVLTVPAGETSGRFCTFEWLVDIPLGTTASIEFRVEARRASGAGDVRAYAPRRFMLGDNRQNGDFPNATLQGNAVLV